MIKFILIIVLLYIIYINPHDLVPIYINEKKCTIVWNINGHDMQSGSLVTRHYGVKRLYVAD